MTEFVKMEECPVEYVPDEHDEARDYEPSFWYWNRRYYLENFIRVHNNPWFSAVDDLPEYIHGMEQDNYYNPLFIGLSDDGETVTIYEEREIEENVEEVESAALGGAA